ncbi:flippase-like domain-containing protein [Epilithonimonas sp. JDS]|uniref:lysylphosphatidylglycerol synthase transmembrane domain-containing protein n=1 Tax=Epilithonimonas sp. JDS TaxID=2902797 RepID=UPI001E4CC9FD|nr:lysylphosphatidylglycerol synthase transmembrane domain-containing protein [Epilithonimonas sp. JDS]MCD9853766.1 flippase-like domain-containing protein [Epilithonimonas sp. JDS]
MEEKKSPAFKNVITVLVSIAIAGLFLWLALRGLDFDKIKVSLKKANYLWVAFAAVFGVSAYIFRAVRWNLLLEPMGHKISGSNSLWAISFGYLMNLTIPRSGEVARSTALYGVEKVPVDKSFGTIILERVVDLVCMGIFALLTLIFKYDALLAFYKAATQQKNQTTPKSDSNITYIILGCVVFILILLFVFRKSLQKLSIYNKVIGFGKGIFEGLKSILTLEQKGKFILYTAGIWICYFFASYLVCFALPETSNFTPADGCFILVVGTLGMIIPASGGIGAFNLAMKFGFTALFISMGKDAVEGGELGLAYSFITLPLQIIIMLVMGLISIPMLARNRKI